LLGRTVLHMARSRRRRSRRSLLRWVALGVVVLLALLYYRPVRAYLRTKDTVDARAAEVQALIVRKRQLEERLAEIRSGATLARGARRLGLVKPGERLFIVRGIPAWRRAHARH
jgi:cell division protein FtsB